MFQVLGSRLQDVFGSLRREVRLTPEAVERTLREIRLALLEADVNFKVVKAFIDRVRDRATERAVLDSLTPSQQVVRHRSRRVAAALRRVPRGALGRGRPAAGGAAGWIAGLGQDHDDRQAGALAVRPGPASASGLHRRAASGGYRAACGACTGRRAAGPRGRLGRPRAARHRGGVRGAAARLRRPCSWIRPGASTWTKR